MDRKVQIDEATLEKIVDIALNALQADAEDRQAREDAEKRLAETVDLSANPTLEQKVKALVGQAAEATPSDG